MNRARPIPFVVDVGADTAHINEHARRLVGVDRLLARLKRDEFGLNRFGIPKSAYF
jgi:hypothetical protein